MWSAKFTEPFRSFRFAEYESKYARKYNIFYLDSMMNSQVSLNNLINRTRNTQNAKEKEQTSQIQNNHQQNNQMKDQFHNFLSGLNAMNPMNNMSQIRGFGGIGGGMECQDFEATMIPLKVWCLSK